MKQPENLSLRRSLELFARSERRIPGGAQTNSKRPSQFAYGGYPIYAQSGNGARIIDVDGNEYIDLVQALGPIILGYCYPAVDEAVANQLAKGTIYGLNSPLEVECAELICDVVPCAEMVRFFKGGGEATAAAARVVRAYTGREIILNAGYRGWPDVWSIIRNDPGIPAGLQGTAIPFTLFDLNNLAERFQEHEGQIAAVFLDILRNEPPPSYLDAVKELCHANGALLVFDEIVTGFRLALGGAQEHYGVTPDLACFAKAMANGMPLACVAGRADVMETMADRLISITYGGEALSLAAATACIHELRDKGVNAYLWELGTFLQHGLNRVAEQTEVPFRCTGVAPMTAMAFTDCGGHDEALLWEYLLQEMAVRGVLLRRGGMNFLTWSHTKADIETVIAITEEVFIELRNLWGSESIAHVVEARKAKRLQ